MFISVIIPVHNRLNLLKNTLSSLESQNFPKNDYEIILIDDGSKEEIGKFLHGYADLNPQVKYLKQKQGGPAKARNLGIKNSKGDIIAFTDSDCVVANDWLNQISISYTQNDVLGIAGKTICPSLNLTPLDYQLNEFELQRHYPTCNISYKKEILKKVGGFDESFRYPHNEDVDLGWRVLQYGKIIYNEKVIVKHVAHEENIKGHLLKLKYLISEFALREKHPELYQHQRSSYKNFWKFIYFDCLIKNKVEVISKPDFIKRYKNPKIFLKSLLLHFLRNLYIILVLPFLILLRRKDD